MTLQRKDDCVFRYLLMTAPADGHVIPCLSTAQNLIERGHAIEWITGRKYRILIDNIGAGFHALPREIDTGEMEIYDSYPRLKELRGLAAVKFSLKNVFLDASIPQIEAINDVLKNHTVDVLVGDTVSFGLFLRSEMRGPPCAMLNLLPLSTASRDTAPFGLGLLPGKNVLTKTRDRMLNFIVNHVILRDITAHANCIRNRLSLEPLNAPFFVAGFQIPSLVMHVSTPAFEYPRTDQPSNIHYIGPIQPELSIDYQPPLWWAELDDSDPVILINQGTVAKDLKDLLIPAVKGLSDLQMLVIAVPVNDGELQECPHNIRAEPFIPFAKLLPQVDVMVTNGGYGGVQMALSHGVPLVIAGATEDKMEVATRVEWAGVGINLRNQRPSPDGIRNAVTEILSNPVYQQNAKRVQADFAKYDAPTRAAELLEMLARGNLD